MPNVLLTPPATPPRRYNSTTQCPPPSPESRIGKFLGPSLELKAILGTGAYGIVYSAYNHFSGIWYAVKALSKTNANGEPLDRRQKEFQAREIQLHYAASAHPNVVSMLKIEEDEDCTYVILEYCPEGDLFSNITEKGHYIGDDLSIRRAFLQTLNAVEHCHNLGIYHRDLKPENILVAKDQVLLADFGLATTDPVSDDHGCGSTYYMSPECLDHCCRKAAYRCAPNDIWSLGVILVNLTCGRNPWKQASTEDPTYKAFTRNRSFLKTILPLSDELNDILAMIFERDPLERITLSDLKLRILECRYFTAPSQRAAGRRNVATQQLASPPQSPCTSDPYEAASPISTCSDSSSIFSNAGLSDSFSAEESDSDYEFEDAVVDQNQDSLCFEIVEPCTKPTFVAPVPQKEFRPTTSFPQLQYALPQESPCQTPASVKSDAFYPYWSYPQQHIGRPQVPVPPLCQPPSYYYQAPSFTPCNAWY